MAASQDGKRELVSPRTLRRIVGVLGVLLPALLVGGCVVLGASDPYQDSISAYYGTVMRNVLVGVLFTIGWFLFAYRGYEPEDDIAGHIACACALGVALFPSTSDHAAIRTVHFVSATSLFVVLAYFSLFLFTKTSGSPTPRKQLRNLVYRINGVVILASIAAIGLYYGLLQHTSVASLRPVFWLETVALLAFGSSWFIKGELFVLKDPPAVS